MKKIIAIVLALAMALSACAFSVFAAGEGEGGTGIGDILGKLEELAGKIPTSHEDALIKRVIEGKIGKELNAVLYGSSESNTTGISNISADLGKEYSDDQLASFAKKWVDKAVIGNKMTKEAVIAAVQHQFNLGILASQDWYYVRLATERYMNELLEGKDEATFIKELQAEIDKLEPTRQEFLKKIDAQKAIIADAEKEIGNIDTQISTNKERIADIDKESDALDAEWEELDDKISSGTLTPDEEDAAYARQDEIDEKLDALDKEKKNLTRTNATLESSKNPLKSKINAANSEIKNIETNMNNHNDLKKQQELKNKIANITISKDVLAKEGKAVQFTEAEIAYINTVMQKLVNETGEGAAAAKHEIDVAIGEQAKLPKRNYDAVMSVLNSSACPSVPDPKAEYAVSEETFDIVTAQKGEQLVGSLKVLKVANKDMAFVIGKLLENKYILPTQATDAIKYLEESTGDNPLFPDLPGDILPGGGEGSSPLDPIFGALKDFFDTIFGGGSGDGGNTQNPSDDPLGDGDDFGDLTPGSGDDDDMNGNSNGDTAVFSIASVAAVAGAALVITKKRDDLF